MKTKRFNSVLFPGSKSYVAKNMKRVWRTKTQSRQQFLTFWNQELLNRTWKNTTIFILKLKTNSLSSSFFFVLPSVVSPRIVFSFQLIPPGPFVINQVMNNSAGLISLFFAAPVAIVSQGVGKNVLKRRRGIQKICTRTIIHFNKSSIFID